MATCIWINANAEQCQSDAQEGSFFCGDHDGVVCYDCGVQATHECGVTTNGLLCSVNLCGGCQIDHVEKCHAEGPEE